MKEKMTIQVSETEAKVIQLWRELKFGEFSFSVQDGVPIGIAKIEIKKDLRKMS